MHRDELWQVYAPTGEALIGEGWESALGNPEQSGSDVIVGAAIVFLYRFNKEGKLEFLWQRRSDKVDRFPGDFDISAGGHVNLGESMAGAAVRECQEEIGARIAISDLRFVTELVFGLNRFGRVYVVDWTGREDEFEFDDGEVSEVRWVPYAEMEEFRMKYAKAPLKKNRLVFECLKEWLLQHGNIQAE